MSDLLQDLCSLWAIAAFVFVLLSFIGAFA